MTPLSSTDWSNELEKCFIRCSWFQKSNKSGSSNYLFKVHHDPDPSSRITFLLIYSLTTGNLFYEGVSFSRFNRSCKGGIADLSNNSQNSYSDIHKEEYWKARIALVERSIGKRKVEGDSVSVEIEENKHSLALSLTLSNASDLLLTSQPFNIKLDEIEQLDRSTSSRVISTQLVQPLVGISSLLPSSDQSQVRELEIFIDQEAKSSIGDVDDNDKNGKTSEKLETTFSALARWSQVSQEVSPPFTSIPICKSSSKVDEIIPDKGLEKDIESPRQDHPSSSKPQSRQNSSSPNASTSLSMTLDESRILPTRINDRSRSSSPIIVNEKSNGKKGKSREGSIISSTIRSNSQSQQSLPPVKNQSESLTSNPIGSGKVITSGRTRPKLKPAKKGSDSSSSDDDDDALITSSRGKGKEKEKPVPTSTSTPNSKPKNYLKDDSSDDDVIEVSKPSAPPKKSNDSSFVNDASSPNRRSDRTEDRPSLSPAPTRNLAAPSTSRLDYAGSDDSVTDDDSPRKKKEEITKEANGGRKADFIMPYSVPGLNQDGQDGSSLKSPNEEKGKGKEKKKKSDLDSSGTDTEDEREGSGKLSSKDKRKESSPGSRDKNALKSSSDLRSSNRGSSEEAKRRRDSKEDEDKEELEKLSKFLKVPVTVVNHRGRGRGRGKAYGF